MVYRDFAGGREGIEEALKHSSGVEAIRIAQSLGLKTLGLKITIKPTEKSYYLRIVKEKDGAKPDIIHDIGEEEFPLNTQEKNTVENVRALLREVYNELQFFSDLYQKQIQTVGIDFFGTKSEKINMTTIDYSIETQNQARKILDSLLTHIIQAKIDQKDLSEEQITSLEDQAMKDFQLILNGIAEKKKEFDK